jgi:hypothetical protein
MLITLIKKALNKLDDARLANDLYNAIAYKKNVNMHVTLAVLTNFIIDEQLKETGLLYRKDDDYILSKVQHLFWEWKNEGIINEFYDFEDTTKNWIMAYA